VHRPLGQQLEDGRTHVAALAASASATAPATRTGWAAEAESKTTAGIEAELEAAAAAGTESEVVPETGVECVMSGILLTQVVAKVFAELSAGLTTLLMEGAAVTGAGAEAESAGRRCEWVGHL
jgi:hypothetical protein